MLKRLIIGFSIISFIFLFATNSNAQNISIPEGVPEIEEQVSVNVVPKFPKPNEEISITLEAFGTDLNRAKISWNVNGGSAKSGTGLKEFTFSAGAGGVTKIVSIEIIPLNGPTITKTVTISPQETDLLWETHTYTPPFYRGKALYSPQEKVYLKAMPNFLNGGGVKLGTSGLIYKWIKNNEVEGSLSGANVSDYSFKGNILMQPAEISVEVTGTGRNKSKTFLTLEPTAPEVILYENNPLYGIMWNIALGSSFLLSKNEINIEAFPYYFGGSSKSTGDISYEWTINGNVISSSNSRGNITFRNTEGKEGESLIGIKVNSDTNFLQEARANSYLNFKARESDFEF